MFLNLLYTSYGIMIALDKKVFAGGKICLNSKKSIPFTKVRLKVATFAFAIK